MYDFYFEKILKDTTDIVRNKEDESNLSVTLYADGTWSFINDLSVSNKVDNIQSENGMKEREDGFPEYGPGAEVGIEIDTMNDNELRGLLLSTNTIRNGSTSNDPIHL